MKFTVFNHPKRPKPWGVRYWLDRRRSTCKFFSTQAEADARKKALEQAFASDGLDGIRRMDEGAGMDEARRIAADSGKTILELVRLGAAVSKGRRVEISGPTVDVAFDGFMARCATIGLRSKSVAFYRENLESLLTTLGSGIRTSEITRAAIRAWIDGRSLKSRPHALRAARAWIRWMLRNEPPLIPTDPTAGMGFEKARGRPHIAILDAKAAEGLLKACPSKARSAVALMLFAGIRHNELHRDPKAPGEDVLRWRDIDLQRRTITVRQEVAKTHVARTIRAIPANLWPWLRPGKPEAPVCSTHLRFALGVARTGSGLKKWGKSILRHTCASHHVAAFGKFRIESAGHAESAVTFFRVRRPGRRFGRRPPAGGSGGQLGLAPAIGWLFYGKQRSRPPVNSAGGHP